MRKRVPGIFLPTIHVTCFCQPPDSVPRDDAWYEAAVKDRIRKVLPNFGDEDVLGLWRIKNVTIKMRMYCLSFRIGARDADEEMDLVRKRVRLE
jgi:hypothetical protein